MACQAILVASKATSGLLHSCVQASVEANAAALAATNETHCLKHIQINLESFSFCMWVHAYGTARSLFVMRITKKHMADYFMR